MRAMLEPIHPTTPSPPQTAPWSTAFVHAQRMLAQWLDADAQQARLLAFRTRRGMAGLGARERAQLARWLAWLLRSRSLLARGDLATRLLHLDARLARAVQTTARSLPPPAHAATVARPTLTAVKRLG